MFSTVAVSALAVLIQTLPAFPPFEAYGVLARQKMKLALVFHTPVETNKLKTVCGMPMIIGKGGVDPKIVMEPRKGVDYKIRIKEAPTCQ